MRDPVAILAGVSRVRACVRACVRAYVRTCVRASERASAGCSYRHRVGCGRGTSSWAQPGRILLTDVVWIQCVGAQRKEMMRSVQRLKLEEK